MEVSRVLNRLKEIKGIGRISQSENPNKHTPCPLLIEGNLYQITELSIETPYVGMSRVMVM
jgi:hypothetical protein